MNLGQFLVFDHALYADSVILTAGVFHAVCCENEHGMLRDALQNGFFSARPFFVLSYILHALFALFVILGLGDDAHVEKLL